MSIPTVCTGAGYRIFSSRMKEQEGGLDPARVVHYPAPDVIVVKYQAIPSDHIRPLGVIFRYPA